MITVKDIKELINNLPDDTPFVIQDPFSEFSYDIDIKDAFFILDHTTKDNTVFYNVFEKESFNRMMTDFKDDFETEEDYEDEKSQYKRCLLIYDKSY